MHWVTEIHIGQNMKGRRHQTKKCMYFPVLSQDRTIFSSKSIPVVSFHPLALTHALLYRYTKLIRHLQIPTPQDRRIFTRIFRGKIWKFFTYFDVEMSLSSFVGLEPWGEGSWNEFRSISERPGRRRIRRDPKRRSGACTASRRREKRMLQIESTTTPPDRTVTTKTPRQWKWEKKEWYAVYRVDPVTTWGPRSLRMDVSLWVSVESQIRGCMREAGEWLPWQRDPPPLQIDRCVCEWANMHFARPISRRPDGLIV